MASTRRYDLTATAWTDCGATPAFVQSIGMDPIRFVVADSAPGSLDAAAHVLCSRRETCLSIGLTAKLFARAATTTATLIVSRQLP